MFGMLKSKKLLVIMLCLLAACGITIAVDNLMGQSNKVCADAGVQGADLEISSLDVIKQSESNPVDWLKERDLRKAIDKEDAAYKQLAAQAQDQIQATGKVEATLRDKGLASAKAYNKASETYAQFWDDNNGKTRAKLAREAGKARLANAQMTFNEINSDNISAYNDQMEVLASARSEYMEEAKTDVSASDRADIKSSLTPRLQNLASNLMSLVEQITGLLTQVQSQVGSLNSVGGLTSCASSIASGDGPTNLISPLTSLMNMVKSLASDAQSLISDLTSF